MRRVLHTLVLLAAWAMPSLPQVPKEPPAKPVPAGLSSLAAPTVRPPTALYADPGDSKVYLEWNANLEESLAGYQVYRSEGIEGVFVRITKAPVQEPSFVDRGVKNGRRTAYRVSAVLQSGLESPRSNVAQATPTSIKALEIAEGRVTVVVPGHEPAAIRNAITAVFENGHRLVFDKDLVRVRDWQAADGTHLVYPVPYGNPVDITEMDDDGFERAQPATQHFPALPPALTLPYFQPTVKVAEAWWVRARAWWVNYTVADNRITFQYRIPITGYRMPQSSRGGYRGWAAVWETWMPVDRVMPGGARFAGLARKIELEMPSSYQEGYSVCLNDGFGVNGSSDGAVTYELQWPEASETHMRETHWKKGEDQRGAGSPRMTRGFHPSNEVVQVSPFLYVRFPQGALLLSPRQYYYSTSFSWRNYAAQGQDGLWPNYATDVAASGRRATIETFEYLWSPETKLKPPQQFIDASFFYRRRLADLYGLQRNHEEMDYAWEHWGPGEQALRGKSQSESLDILRQWGADIAEKADRAGADMVGGAAELWTSSPYTVPDAIRLNPAHPLNVAIGDTIAAIRKRGLKFGYWVRPEFVKQPYPIAISTRFYTEYYGYVRQLFPPATPITEADGLALIRKHPEWIRLSRGATHATRTPYDWTPMSLVRPGWYEEVVYKTLAMMRTLGYGSVFQDGGFSNLAGVDYSTTPARPVQPYYWRFYQDMTRLGLSLNGECMTGWVTNNVGTLVAADLKHLWAFSHGNHRGNLEGNARRFFSGEMRHISHQLYTSSFINLDGGPEHEQAARFAQKFVRQNGHPDRVFLEGLRYDEPGGMWRWDNVWWEYAGGKRVRYPNFAEVAR